MPRQNSVAQPSPERREEILMLMRFHRLLLLLPLCAMTALALAGFGFARPQEAPPAEPAAAPAAPQGYAGSDACAACHSEVADQLATTPHGKEVFARKASQGCESCHGPGAAHAEDPDNPALRPSITKLAKKQQSAICQSCHDGRQQLFWQGSMHQKRNVSCTDCH